MSVYVFPFSDFVDYMKATTRLICTSILLFGFCPAFAANNPEFELVIWNQHNGDIRDRGSKICNVEVLNGSTILWKRDKVELKWKPDADAKTSITVPKLTFSPDRVRITITEWIGNGGGLAEVELLRGGENIARHCKVSASGMFDHRFRPRLVIDGIRTSATNFVGYWLLPDVTKGWIELQIPRK